jgi:MoaA/NifB/PqqE/SkfB family radical SAM enzyme
MRKIIIPKEIRINVGSDCNLNCISCSKQGPKDINGKFLNLLDYLKLIDELKRYSQARAVSITGGEPLHPKLINTTIKLIKKSKPWDVRLCTNAHFINTTLAKKLKKIGVNSVQVGLDSATNEFQNFRARSKSAWELTVQGIKNAIKSGLNVSARFTLYRENLDEVQPTYKFAESLGAKQFKLRILFPVGGCIKNCMGSVPSGRQLAQAQYEALLVSKGSETKLELSQPSFFMIPGVCNAFIEDNTSCGELNNASVNARGLVEYCLFCEDGEAFGNIQNNSFLELWNSTAIKTARRARKRKGVAIGCPAFEFQYNKYISDYRKGFEINLIKRTRELQKNLL